MRTKCWILALSLPFVITGCLVLQACDPTSTERSNGNTGSKEPDEPSTEIKLEPVAPDGRLETVTWNLEWYGVDNKGPADEQIQSENILQVIDSLHADLYAFQEVHDQSDLNRIVEPMQGYRGFVADFIGYSQRMAFVYNTSTIDSISAGPIIEGQSEYVWAGRFPLYFEFNYTYDNSTTSIYAIVIHAKAFDDEESYQRRKVAANDLYTYLNEQKPDARIIFLGDYNDDVDQSIYNGEPSPYQVFSENDQEFRVVTKIFSENGVSSTVNYQDMIDHITISNELYNRLIEQSEQVYSKAGDFIPDYGRTTSDHYPVWAKFDLSGN